MPELPEVETVARGLAQRVMGDEITSVWLGSKKEPLKSSAALIARTLEYARIVGVRRVGKQIVFDLLNPAGYKSQWIVHLGMTGQMLVSSPDAEIKKLTHAIVKLASGRELRFVDPRRFGRLSIANGDFAGTGMEPLELDFGAFRALFRGRKTPIKSALLNQKLLGGVGNIYADESLFRAGIRPRRRAGSLTGEQLHRLYKSLRTVLKQAIRLGGSSISDYVGADGEEGFFQFRHRVYGREGQPCLVCKRPVKRVVIGGRSSHYCTQCQK
jgi:formamidopyrimidine-DNA glycosylase